MIESTMEFPTWLYWLHMILIVVALTAFVVVSFSRINSLKTYYMLLAASFVVGAVALVSYTYNPFGFPQEQSVTTKEVKQNLELGLGGARVVEEPEGKSIKGICETGFKSEGWVVKEEGEEVKLSVAFICSGDLIRFDPVPEEEGGS